MASQQVTESEIQAAYSGLDKAENYVARRFESELTRLLHDRQVQAVQRFIEAHKPRRVLEIAPGPGRITREIRAPGEHVALEFNAGMIEVGRRECPDAVKWIQGNAFELPFDAGDEFDLVYTFRFIRHFKLDDRKRLYEQVQRVLRPGGCVIFDAVNEPVSRPLREAEPESYPIYDELYTSIDVLRSELEENGFELTESVGVQRWMGLQYRSQVLIGPRCGWLNRWVIRALERLRSGPPLEWIVTARRA